MIPWARHSSAVFIVLSVLQHDASAAVCSEIFSNVVGTTGGALTLSDQPRLVNTGGGVLATTDLLVSGKKADKACDNAPCSASGVPAASAPVPVNGSTLVYSGSPSSFTAGDYYYGDFTISGKASQITVTSGTVRIHVAGDLVIDDVRANFGGDPEDLVFFVAGNVEITDKARVSAIIYSEGAAVISGNGTQFEGALTADSVEVSDKARMTFDPSAVSLADFGGFCDNGVGVTGDADAFNCVAGGADGVTGHLHLQKVGTPFVFDVVALQDSNGDGDPDTTATGFASNGDHNLTVELVDASGGLACLDQPALSPPIGQTLVFTAADGGRRSVAAMTLNRAYRSVACRVTDTSVSPVLTGCSVDTFTIRPTALTLLTPALDNSGATGGPSAAAGSPFGLSVDGGAGYTGAPQIDSSRLLAHPGAVQVGALTGLFAAADAADGIATGTAFAYSEVGNFRFASQGLFDDSFAAVDAANGDCTDDFSNNAVGGLYGCRFGNLTDSVWVGRFHPASLAVQTLADGSLGDSCVAGGFSYQGEAVPLVDDVVFRVTARNSGGDTTQNYTGSYAKLAGTDFVFAAVTADGTQLGADASTPVTAAWTTPGARGLTDNGDGTLDLAISGAAFTWGRLPNDRIAPFTTDLAVSLTALSDADAVSAAGLPMTATPTGVDMRYGRVTLVNAHGSELQDLSIPMQVEYYAGAANGFIVHAIDSCTVIPALAFTDLDVGDGLQVTETCVWDDDDDSGLGCSGTAPPGRDFESSPAAGLFDLHLKAPGSGNSGVLQVTAAAPGHLAYDWLGTGDTAPGARATFGIFNRPSTIIFRRELR